MGKVGGEGWRGRLVGKVDGKVDGEGGGKGTCSIQLFCVHNYKELKVNTPLSFGVS